MDFTFNMHLLIARNFMVKKMYYFVIFIEVIDQKFYIFENIFQSDNMKPKPYQPSKFLASTV